MSTGVVDDDDVELGVLEGGKVFREMVLHYIIQFVGKKNYSVYQGALSI